MGEPKIQRIDYPPLQDLLNDIEPVHAVDSGALEEISYDIPVMEDDFSADSLQRSAGRFKTQAPAVKPGQQFLKDYLAKQEFIKLQPNYHVVVQEYLERHINEFPFMDASFVKELHIEIFGGLEKISSTRHVEISEGMEIPDSYQCLVMVPINNLTALQKTKAYRDTLTTLLFHEIQGHCRDFDPRSEFWQTMRKAELVKPAVRSGDSEWQKALRAYLELSAYIRNIDFMMKELNFAKNPDVVIEPFREALHNLIGKYAATVIMKLGFLDLKKRELVAGFFKKQMSRARKDTRDYFRKILREDYGFNNKSLGLIGL